MAFELPQLPYAYDALEPYIDARDGNSSFVKHHNIYRTMQQQQVLIWKARQENI
jgi:superoxide dismutase